MNTLNCQIDERVHQPLAIHGGPKVRSAPMPVRRLFDESDKQAILNLFDLAIVEGSHLLGYGGPQEEAYCQAFCQFMEGGYADGVNSGTNAVYVALRSMELEPFTEVIVPPVSDPGGVMPVVMCQLIPVPTDSEADSFNIDPTSIETNITPHTAAILVAHISGRPANMDAIMAIARRYNLKVIEDCAQAHGARYKGRPVGTIGDVAAFSTMFGKHHACGGQGGLVYSREKSVYWRVRRHADRGKPFGLDGESHNVAAGLNCNMDELHATVGLSQVRKLPIHLAHIRQLAYRIADGTRSLTAVHMLEDQSGCEGAYWFVILHLDTDKLSVDKSTFVETLNAEGVQFVESYLHSPAVWSWFKRRSAFGASQLPWRLPGNETGAEVQVNLPNLLAVDRTHITVKIHEGYTEGDVDDIIAALHKVEAAYLRASSANACGVSHE